MMLIVADREKETTDFIDKNLKDYSANPSVASYMQFIIALDRQNITSEQSTFLTSREITLPEVGQLVAIAMDENEKIIGMLSIKVGSNEAIEETAEFQRTHSASQVDAEMKWSVAFELAKGTDRKVFAKIGQRYCGPCFLLARWMDDQRDLFDKDYVILRIDSFHDLKGIEVARRLTLGRQLGIPFYAIFDADEVMLTDADGPLGNTGMPSSFDGKLHLRKMLQSTSKNLTTAEIDELISSIP